ncbi:ribosomal protein S12 methylthiotransferase [Caldicoprobacter guelmensis]|uniref:30S ribosomal protein S12 methylthiotransferase RimO n=1 Tax=Caldicoprobacter guelmensis TaxID=1170224 RepID=UPI001957A22D|nr:30S ribosomal protein S12 methylthiotransferase RimO [Caldicoprobacter guelmensis]MBM7581463.1 ribosomal protein S12 methylthiotransferase [Caldicoprobacter guelmensis]
MKIGMVSLGCDKNRVDAEVMLGLLSQAGHTIVNKPEEADVIIVNTCGFIDPAKEESVETILEYVEYKKAGKCRLLVVTGCLAQRYSKELMDEIPEVDAVIGTGRFNEIVDVINQCELKHERLMAVNKPKFPNVKGIVRVLTTPSYTAYLKISEGCSNCCTYCVIPQLRGPHVSRPMDEVLEEAQALVDRGVKEIILVGQDLTRYGQDLEGDVSLAKLLKELVKIPELVWIRLLYCYPDRVSDDLINAIASEEKVCNYIDIPLQHINPKILKKMNRPADPRQIRSLLIKLRERIPDIIIRTSLIVGFPGEGEQEFKDLIEFVEESQFSRVGVFTYSREEGTPAANFPEQVDEKTKEARRDILMSIQQKISKRLNRKRIGQECKVLIEGTSSEGIYFGRSYGEAPEIDGQVFVMSNRKLKAGDFVEVKITKAYEYDLLGEDYESSK